VSRRQNPAAGSLHSGRQSGPPAQERMRGKEGPIVCDKPGCDSANGAASAGDERSAWSCELMARSSRPTRAIRGCPRRLSRYWSASMLVVGQLAEVGEEVVRAVRVVPVSGAGHGRPGGLVPAGVRRELTLGVQQIDEGLVERLDVLPQLRPG